MAAINFFSEDVDFKLAHPRKTSKWIKTSIESEKKVLGGLNYIFCTDNYLLDINIKYLNHKTLTDIITFDQSDGEAVILGDIYISLDRVKENAVNFETTFDNELHRVIIHGALHLMGYSDKNLRAKSIMRKKEDAYLSLRK